MAQPVNSTTYTLGFCYYFRILMDVTMETLVIAASVFLRLDAVYKDQPAELSTKEN